ncbi:exodeoxyribonuclease VII large subunit [Antarcticirhabdus aurantiaca]|uniref:Exodeoxyribonuclease VII large subunit n=1 Tax=Antarcticirhabdus aurantiaca TaxID=2606717 RepID=A0ACD4NLG1_9HYPH|nr:exodeoxyribonuclease VII large subunit [Antarcticirhabdus aurantiaca]WAJ27623.1 exodeoxyribonuclease VII large subunit [Jeongeuplla avenae]
MSQAIDLDLLPEPTTNVAEYSVSEISGALKRTVEETFGHVRVRGEISGYRGPHSSGHAYFALKDDKARIDAVVWRTSFAKLAFRPEEGLEVVATGRLTTFPGSSKYQIVIEDLKPAGAGALMALLNERRVRLEAEGLFAAERKKPLPFLPQVIGIVTSPTGAVIRDICHRIADRFPLRLLVWPVRVQGDTCPAEVAAAIKGFNALEPGGAIPRPDLIIVARGGGSLEDLWGFNDEAVVRAAAGSLIPLISAVGHETDWTLIDHAADRRAPTPTGAAEMAVPVRAELHAALASLHARHGQSVTRRIDAERRHVTSLARALPSVDMLLALPRRRVDEAETGLGRALRLSLSENRRRFGEAASPLSPNALDGLVRDKRADLRHAEGVLGHALSRGLAAKRQRFDRASLSLQPRAMSARSDAHRQRLVDLGRRLPRAQRFGLERLRTGLDAQWRVALSLNPDNVLSRGYAILRRPGAGPDGQPITSASELPMGAEFVVQLADGLRGAVSTGTENAGAARTKRARRAAAHEATTPAKQGLLFE